MSITLDGSNANTVGVVNAATAKNSTSGTAIDFTAIPAGVKRITIAFNGVSTSGTSNLQLQLGSSGGVETTGYASCANSYNNSPATSTATAGILLWNIVAAANLVDGIVHLVNVSGNIWVASGTMINETGSVTVFGGRKTVAAILDRVRITTANGTDAFDAGSINILYE